VGELVGVLQHPECMGDTWKDCGQVGVLVLLFCSSSVLALKAGDQLGSSGRCPPIPFTVTALIGPLGQPPQGCFA